MPPLTVDRLKAAAEHDAAQKHAVIILLLCDAAIVGMGDRAEAVKRTAHVKLPACRHIQQSQVDRTAAAVRGLFCDITALEQLLLLQIGVEIRLHADILILDPPQHEMLDRADGTISVKHLDAVALNCRSSNSGSPG